MIKRTLNKSVDGCDYQRIFHLICRNGQNDEFDRLLYYLKEKANGVKLHKIHWRALINEGAESGSMHIITRIFENGIKPSAHHFNFTQKQINTAAMQSVQNNNLDALKFFISKGANNYDRLIAHACKNKRHIIFDFFVQYIDCPDRLVNNYIVDRSVNNYVMRLDHLGNLLSAAIRHKDHWIVKKILDLHRKGTRILYINDIITKTRWQQLENRGQSYQVHKKSITLSNIIALLFLEFKTHIPLQFIKYLHANQIIYLINRRVMPIGGRHNIFSDYDDTIYYLKRRPSHRKLGFGYWFDWKVEQDRQKKCIRAFFVLNVFTCNDVCKFNTRFIGFT